MIGRAIETLKHRGAGLLQRFAGQPGATTARCFRLCQPRMRGKVGLEIGGPSVLFGRDNLLPVYPLAERIDNGNFSRRTVWEGTIEEGETFVFDPAKPPGRQLIIEAADLRALADERYDFLLSSHVLEHIANPLGALREWQRVLKAGGLLLLVVPHRDGTFDHRRPVTPFQHLLDDLARGTSEEDLTHLAEALELHDLERDPGVSDRAAFVARSQLNAENRCLHHHIFDTPLLVQAVDQAGFQIMAVETVLPFHIIVAAHRPRRGRPPHNAAFLGPTAAYRRESPFPSDRLTTE